MADPWAQFVPPDPGAAAAPADPWAQFVAPSGAVAPPPDKYQQQATSDLAKAKAAGMDMSYGPGETFMNGRMLGALPTVMAGLLTPAEMIRHGTIDPTEGYNYAKARENAEVEQGNAAHPYANAGASLAGGVMTGAGASKAGLTFAPAVEAGAPAPGLMATAAGMAGDGAAYGGVAGFNSGEGADRFTNAATGAAVGGLTGAVLPVAASAIAGNPLASQLSARVNPQGFASSQLARALLESGQTPEALQGALDSATAAGQPNYALADALGHSGQRMLTSVTKSPGPGRQAAADFLEQRQAGQAGDVSSVLADALGAPKTAAQTTATLTKARDAAADANYGAARASAGAVDVSPAIKIADQTLMPGVTRLVNPNSGIADNSIESAVRKAKALLTDGKSNLSDFNQVFQAKAEIQAQIEAATPTVQRALIPIKNALDDQLAATSAPYANARNTFRAQSQGIDAIPEGTAAAAGRVRSADAVDQFNALPQGAQQPFRVGFSDPLIAKAEATAPTANAARPLLNDATQAKLAALSLHNGPYQPGAENAVEQRLGRSNTMFQTRAKALGGSSTVENMNDQHASGIDPSALWDAATEGIPGLVRGAMRVGKNFLGGSTPAVRSALGEALLMHGPGADVAGKLGPAVQMQITRAALARALAAGGVGGGAALSSNEIEASRSGPR